MNAHFIFTTGDIPSEKSVSMQESHVKAENFVNARFHELELKYGKCKMRRKPKPYCDYRYIVSFKNHRKVVIMEIYKKNIMDVDHA